MAKSTQCASLIGQPNIYFSRLERPDPLRTKRLYFGTLDLEMGEISLSGNYVNVQCTVGVSVVTASKLSLPPACRQLKQQFNVKLISFENATVSLPPFRQFHYFETSAFLFEAMQKFYFGKHMAFYIILFSRATKTNGEICLHAGCVWKSTGVFNGNEGLLSGNYYFSNFTA